MYPATARAAGEHSAARPASEIEISYSLAGMFRWHLIPAMPITTTFTPDGAGLLRVVHGFMIGAELIAVDTALLDDAEAFARLRYVLHDFGDTTELRATPAEARALAALDVKLTKLNPRLCVAVIAPRDIQFGMGRMWEVYAQGTGWETAMFRDRPSALAWLRERVHGLTL